MVSNLTDDLLRGTKHSIKDQSSMLSLKRSVYAGCTMGVHLSTQRYTEKLSEN